MKKMIPLQRLLDEAENDNIDADTTLIDVNGIAVLDDNYSINPEPLDAEDQESS